MTDAQTRVCTGCGRQIPIEDDFCHFCGRSRYQQQPYYSPSTQPYQQQQYSEPVGGLKYVLYILSFLSGLVMGLIIFLLWKDDLNPEKRQIGKNCLIIGVVSLFLSILTAAIIVAFFWDSFIGLR